MQWRIAEAAGGKDPSAMPRPTPPETSKERVARYRADARKLLNQRTLNSDESDEAMAEMVRRSISEHGA